MLQLPREPQAGEKLDAAFARQILRYLRSITPRSSPHLLVSIGANGTTFGVAAPGGRNVATAPHPFQVINASTESTAKVRVVFGQVNSLTPTIGGTALDADPDDPPLLTVASGVVYLAVILDAYGIALSASIHNDAVLPTPDETHGYLTLATVAVTSGAITALNQAVTHSLGHQLCGGTTHRFWGL